MKSVEGIEIIKNPCPVCGQETKNEWNIYYCEYCGFNHPEIEKLKSQNNA